MGMHKGLIGKSDGGGSVKPTYEDKTLGDYIARKTRQDAFNQVAQENRLTFDEWFKDFATSACYGLIISGMTFEDWLFAAWQAGKKGK